MQLRLARVESDCPAIAGIVNAYQEGSASIEVVQKWFTHMPPGRIAHRTVITNTQGEVIGYGVCVHETWWTEGEFYTWVGVLPQARGQGAGSLLYQDADAFLHEQNAATLTSEVRDNDPVSQGFAEHRRFKIERHWFSSSLDVAAFDETPYCDLIPTHEAAGIRFFRMADVPNTTENRQRLYELNKRTELDVPGYVGAYMSFAEYEQRVLGAASYCPDGQIIAADGETWIGFTSVILYPDREGAFNRMTGVLLSYRGRKIALALKLLAVRYTRQHGTRYLDTNNDSFNTPILAINRKMGYQPKPGIYRLRKNTGSLAFSPGAAGR